eukprot:TRINITY_DN14991_c0_g2_i1.p1 TRINITY_DN14991_c0_g2~~TRINITY_DN14991_c0_g2_i1.p1  ORF type:complete len:115 (-),score=9.77 TRINITY_DN14991_c0_g2_i1:89-433(-)
MMTTDWLPPPKSVFLLMCKNLPSDEGSKCGFSLSLDNNTTQYHQFTSCNFHLKATPPLLPSKLHVQAACSRKLFKEFLAFLQRNDNVLGLVLGASELPQVATHERYEFDHSPLK